MSRNLAVFTFTFILLLTPGWSVGQAKESRPTTFRGYLIDLACARERKEEEADLGQKHTRKCMGMPICDRSGFGILMDANELLRFDEDGNRKVRALLARTSQDNNLRVVVHGKKTSDVLEVKKIELARP